MKKFLIVLGGIFALIIIYIVITVAIVAIKGSKLDAESKKYVDEIMPKIINTWSGENLIRYASPQLLNTTNKLELKEQMNALYKQLGESKTYKGSKGEANISINNGTTKITAEYVCVFNFRDADIDVKVTLIKNTDTWQILSLNLNQDKNDKKEEGWQRYKTK